MAEKDIQWRTLEFLKRIIRLCRAIGEGRIEQAIAGQLFRAGTSIGANIEEAQGSHGSPDFINKMVIARKEARETRYWLRLVESESFVDPRRMAEILDESDQLVRIISSIVVNARRNAELYGKNAQQPSKQSPTGRELNGEPETES